MWPGSGTSEGQGLGRSLGELPEAGGEDAQGEDADGAEAEGEPVGGVNNLDFRVTQLGAVSPPNPTALRVEFTAGAANPIPSTACPCRSGHISVSRSCSTPRTAPPIATATRVAGSGAPHTVRLAAISPPIMAYSPWAKLITPETLAHRTNPIATSA